MFDDFALDSDSIILPQYYNRPSSAAPKVYAFLQAVKQNEAADLPLGVAGFCWGGYFVTKVCSGVLQPVDSSSPPIVACGFTAHPSLLKYPTDIEGVKLPYSVAAAENDFQMSKPNAKVTREILERKNKENLSEGKAVPVQHEFVLYDGVHHGFAVRADEDAKLEAEAGKKAEAQAIAWFTKWFAQAQAAAPTAAAAAAPATST
jgi:dienelactone hydrolase